MSDAWWLLVGLVVGAGVAFLVLILRKRQEQQHTRQLLEEHATAHANELTATLERVKSAFAALSREALSANSDDFLRLAKTSLEKQSSLAQETLESKKKLIDARLDEVGKGLLNLDRAMQQIEKQRSESHGTLRGQLEKSTQATVRLQETTSKLREALASSKQRGQWGERMAEDVLRLAGFIEGVNYFKQRKLPNGNIPDFSFPLPGNFVVHMDVKFPLDNYLKMLECQEPTQRKALAGQFIKDVRARVKEVTTRSYVDPTMGTVDYMLVFIPNEQIYGFIHETDSVLLDDALRSKVVLCAPLTLYANLAVIRQAVDNFRLEQTSGQILKLLAEFKKQWAKYVESMDRMGDRLESALKEYQKLSGTRTRQLERQLDKIDDLQVLDTGTADETPLVSEDG